MPVADDKMLYELPFPEAGPKIPTWGMNHRIVEALKQKTKLFEERRFQWRFGREQEFSLNPIRPLSEEFIAHKRAQLKSEWERNGTGDLRQQQLAEIDRFTPEELMILELHVRLKGMLTPRFGKQFYDVQPGVFEVSTRVADPITDVKQFHALHSALRDLAKEYGFQMAYRKRDITFSIQNGDKTWLFDARPGQRDARGLRATDGILRVVADAPPAFVRPYILDHFEPGQQYTIGICRDNKLRWRSGRTEGEAMLELRDDNNMLAGEHAALENLLIMAGAEYGLFHNRDPHYAHTISKSEFLSKPIFTTDNPQLFFLMEILNLASVNTDGRVVFDDEHRLRRSLYKYNKYLRTELGARPDADLVSWFKSLHLNREKSGLDIDAMDLSAVTDDRDRLEEHLASVFFGQEAHRIRNHSGYKVDMIGERGESYYPGATGSQQFINRMAESEALKVTLGTELFDEILGAYAQHFNMPKPAIPNGRAR